MADVPSLAATVLPQLIENLRSYEPQARREALGSFAQLVDTSQAADAFELGAYLREVDAFDDLVECIDDPDPYMHQTALLLLGNFASDAFDSRSSLTKDQLKEVGCFERVMPHLYSEDWLTLVYALGCVQNMCTDLDYVNVMQETGVVQRLHELSNCGDDQLGRFATGCLANMRESILAAAARQHWRQRTAHAAATVIQADARRFLATRRVQEMREARRHKLGPPRTAEEARIRELEDEVRTLSKEKGIQPVAIRGVRLDAEDGFGRDVMRSDVPFDGSPEEAQVSPAPRALSAPDPHPHPTPPRPSPSRPMLPPSQCRPQNQLTTTRPAGRSSRTGVRGRRNGSTSERESGFAR